METGRVPAVLQQASHARGEGRAAAGAEPRHDRRPRESPGVSMAAARSWPISHAENRVTTSIRSGLTRTIYEFATDRTLRSQHLNRIGPCGTHGRHNTGDD